MDFSAQPSWTDNFPTGYFQPGTADPLYKKVSEDDLVKQRLSYYLAKGNNTGFQVPLNPKGPSPPITKPDKTSIEGFTNPTPNYLPILFLLFLLIWLSYKKIL